MEALAIILIIVLVYYLIFLPVAYSVEQVLKDDEDER